jgi:hypothetical protein
LLRKSFTATKALRHKGKTSFLLFCFAIHYFAEKTGRRFLENKSGKGKCSSIGGQVRIFKFYKINYSTSQPLNPSNNFQQLSTFNYSFPQPTQWLSSKRPTYALPLPTRFAERLLLLHLRLHDR